MDGGKPTADASEESRGAAADAFPELDAPEVDTLREYARGVTAARRRSVEEIFEGPDEVLTAATARAGYLEVHKRTPCGSGCDSCPHGPYVYHVRRERHPSGETRLHWVLIGSEVAERS